MMTGTVPPSADQAAPLTVLAASASIHRSVGSVVSRGLSRCR